MFSFQRLMKFAYFVVLGSAVLVLSLPAPARAQRTLAYPFIPGPMITAASMAQVLSAAGTPMSAFRNAQLMLAQAATPAGLGVGGMGGGVGGVGGVGGGLGGGIQGMMGMGGMGGIGGMGGMGGMGGNMMGMGGLGGGMRGGMGGGMGGAGGMGGFAGKGFGGFNGKKAL